MIRSILRSISRFVAAVILLALLLCAVEVYFRASRLRQNVNSADAGRIQIAAPDETTYLETIPLIDIDRVNVSGKRLIIKTNEFGLRNDIIRVPKPQEHFRILCLGAGHTFGLGVSQSETFCSQLEALLQSRSSSKVEVLNAGCPGTGPLIQYLRLRQRLLQLQPDLVILNLSPEDLNVDAQLRGITRVDEQQIPLFAPHPQFTAKGSAVIDQTCEEFVVANLFVNQLEGMLGVRGTETVHLAGAAVPDEATRLVMPRFAIIEQLQTLVAGRGITFLVSILPGSRFSEDATLMSGLTPQQLEIELRESLRAKGLERVPVFNSTSAMQQLDANQRFLSHADTLSPEGHELYARILAEFLVSKAPR